MERFLQEAKNASRVLAELSGFEKNRVLREMASALRANTMSLLEANALDMRDADINNLSVALKDRLLLDEKRIDAMAVALEEISALKEPVGRILDGWITEDGLKIEKVSIPIGVIGIIYESRPNVTSDTAALCFKSSNVCVLKGGKDEPIGGCSIHDIDTANKNAYFGYVLGKRHWGKGYATEAAGMMLELGFKTLKFHKMSANVFPENPASERILKKYGMILEGIQREKYFKKGKWRDLLNYGILEKEYRKR